MHPILEYLAVGILVVTIMLAVGLMMETPSKTVEAVTSEQLFTVAERLMDKILLTPGHPPDWGSNIYVTSDELQDFGVSLSGASAPYIVDPDKVMRLAKLAPLPNPMPIDAERIAELLGTKGAYGFRLEMKPMIVISAFPVQRTVYNLVSTLRVSVKNWEGIGLPNANVTALYVIVTIKGGGASHQDLDLENLIRLKGSCITGPLGDCILDFTSSLTSANIKGPDPSSFFIIHVSWEGFVSVTGYSPDDDELPIVGYVIGNVIFVERPDEPVRGAIIVKDEVVQVIPQYATLLEPVEVEWCRSPPGGKDPDDPLFCHEVAGNVLPSSRVAYLFGKITSLEMLSSHVIIFGKWHGRWRGAVISRIPVVDIQLGPHNVKPVNLVTLTRVAVIYNYPYIVRLTVWRWTEG